MSKSAKKRAVREEELPRQLKLAEFLYGELREFIFAVGNDALALLLERERTAACGPRYVHNRERRAHRAGHVQGELVMGGRRVSVRRPRARTEDGREVTLPSWRQFSAEDPLQERAVEQMLLGVSTRRYADSLEPLSDALPERGASKSAVSRRFVAATEERCRAFLGRTLGDLNLAVLMLDGVHVGGHVLLIALGVDVQGNKHVLGVREGATENAAACTALLSDLRERGMATGKSTLVVLDGSKALAKAVRDVFGSRAILQRCQVHKARNVLDQLPDKVRPMIHAALRRAWNAPDAETALRQLRSLVKQLKDQHPGAAASLEEGLEETVTILRMDLPPKLARSLATTNAIENVIGSMRRISRRVKNWKDGRMCLRWTVAAVDDASARFRRFRGHAGMPTLVRYLRQQDEALDSKKEAA